MSTTKSDERREEKGTDATAATLLSPNSSIAEFTANFASLTVGESKPRHNSEPAGLNSTLDQESYLIGQTVFNNIMMQLPDIINHHLEQTSTPNSKQMKSIESQNKELKKIKTKQNDLEKRLVGLTTRMDIWTEKVKETKTSFDNLQQTSKATRKTQHQHRNMNG